ncbi:N-acetyltransferase [Cryobacterium sp. TMT1-21]|uniref:N-acetyltransferase n=1 Tax=Cryobacterium shii TaxID=1259235 RepID=A0AAQ2HG20_9MICO|nr:MULTISPECIES: GNAT family N-acetyltransferase [Cryobacterium]TFC49832.1 N-acetyltransferase [Cryobacterium shii]TFC86016.1 N-acetyltransferase [Cryobacterium sp. TmT2-59]TFD13757.1 N-acetyltransferase [Cryobacterium sp. TMT4-10]TFD16736.1 N-acetyltransferase [Cryobacterium sp. TMT1-21]TFD19727.1 N-acetyltransferase [Cryobacterium sp. TMT2-23]
MTSREALLAAYDAQLRLRVPAEQPAGIRFELRGSVLRVVGWHQGFVETAREVGLTGSALDALIAGHRDFFAARGEAVEWKTRGHDEPADLTRRLIAAGFVPEAPETVVVGETARLTARPGSGLPDGVTIRQVDSRADFDGIADVQTQVWGTDQSWLAGDLETSVRDAPGDVLVFVAEAAGEVVSSCRLEFTPGTDFAGLWGGSTLAAWRGRGIYRALVAHRARLAHDRGVRYLQVDASEDSKPILLRLGFQTLTTTTPYVWTPPAPAPD